MSLLLDALNKADQERKRHEVAPGINSNHEAASSVKRKKFPWAQVFFLLVGAGILITIIAWLKLIPQTTPPVIEGASITRHQNSEASLSTESTQLQNNRTYAKNPDAEKIDTRERGSIVTEDLNNTDENVAHLYRHTARNTVKNTVPSQAIAATAAPNTSDSNSPNSISQYANIPDLYDLPPAILVKIPSLSYNEHNYNSNGGSVKINGAIKHPNELLAEGVVIDKILEDGMILHIEGYSFKMKALNSWVNM